MNLVTVPVLCVMEGSNYNYVAGVDLYDKERDCRSWSGGSKLIAHPPCQQWSRMKGLAKESKAEKELGPYCVELVRKYGGVLEHPKGSSLFKYCGVDMKKVFEVKQFWWGFPAQKATLLYCEDVELLQIRIKGVRSVVMGVCDMGRGKRSLMPVDMCEYLVDCVRKSY